MEQICYRRINKIAGIVLGIFIAVQSLNAQAAKLYKWVDEDGVVHYSDKIPPEVNKDAHEELDHRGISRRELGRAKTEEERMSEKVEQAAVEQQRKVAAEKLARQRMRDQILLQTFTTERDLIITRDDRLNAIDSILNLTANNNKRIVQQIEETKKRITRVENSGRQVPENIMQKLESLNNQFEKNKGFMELKKKERVEQSERFEADLSRFRELKGIGTEEETATEQQDAAETSQEEAETEQTAEANQAPN